MPSSVQWQEYDLPAYWASYLVNGDASGLSDAERAECDAWHTLTSRYSGIGPCVSVSDEPEFRRSNDANHLAGDVLTYTFQVLDR